MLSSQSVADRHAVKKGLLCHRQRCYKNFQWGCGQESKRLKRHKQVGTTTGARTCNYLTLSTNALQTIVEDKQKLHLGQNVTTGKPSSLILVLGEVVTQQPTTAFKRLCSLQRLLLPAAFWPAPPGFEIDYFTSQRSDEQQ
jgi:hypothetical protein